VNLVIRRVTIAVLAAFIAGAVLVVPASAKSGPQAVAAKKKAKKCKKKKKGKKKKGCKGVAGGGGASGSGLPGEKTPTSPTQPDNPTIPNMASVDLAANPVLAGTSSTGTVTVDGPAPSAGQKVDLTSSNSARVSVPASVVVAPGQTTASFSITTTSGSPLTATLTGETAGTSANVQLNVVDKPSVKSVELQRQCFTFGSFGSNRVTLDVPAPADTLIDLVSDNPSALQVPSDVTVPEGSSSAFFSVNALAATLSVGVTATLDTSQATDTALVSSTDPDPEAGSLSVNPDKVKPGNGTTATVTLACEAPTGGVTVDLTSDDPGVTVPASVNVPAGKLSQTFDVDTDPTLPNGVYDIHATVGGVTVDASLTIDSTLPT
jgi:trimeric autotransporter adhesin